MIFSVEIVHATGIEGARQARGVAVVIDVLRPFTVSAYALAGGAPVAAAVREGVDIFAASLVVAQATAQACLLRRPTVLTLVASADHPEDHACALYIEAIIRGGKPDVERLLRPLKQSERYTRLMSGTWPGFPPTDLELALQPDRFSFAMPVTRGAGYLRLTRADQARLND